MRPDFSEMIEEVWQLKQKCGHVNNIYVDASSPEIVQALKREFEERYDEQWISEQKAYCKKYNLHLEDRMFIVPISFAVEGAKSAATHKVSFRRTGRRRFKSYTNRQREVS